MQELPENDEYRTALLHIQEATAGLYKAQISTWNEAICRCRELALKTGNEQLAAQINDLRVAN